MRIVAVSQRVAIVPERQERRDCLDQAWPRFLGACGLLPLALPNQLQAALELCSGVDIAGVLLTGGNDLASLGGDAPERDAVEQALLEVAEQRGLPVLGVCRGMQLIQHLHGTRLGRVEGHVTRRQRILIDGEPAQVNSFHHFGALQTFPPLQSWAVSDDGVVKAIRHSSRPLTGIMWHPERLEPFRAEDVALFRRTFGVVN